MNLFSIKVITMDEYTFTDYFAEPLLVGIRLGVPIGFDQLHSLLKQVYSIGFHRLSNRTQRFKLKDEFHLNSIF